jgi:hypothetical protein
MVDTYRIPDLPSATALTGVETLEVVQGGVNKKISVDTVADYAIPPTGVAGEVLVGGVVWSSAPVLLGTVTVKPAGTAGIRLDPNAKTGDFVLSLSPKNLTADRRVQFPDADFDFGGGVAGQVLVGPLGWSSALSLLSTVGSKPAGTAGIRLDPNAATGDFDLSLSPKNLTAARRVSFPDRDLDLSPVYSDGTRVGLGLAPNASNGLLQFGAGTTKASAASWSDIFIFRDAASSLAISDGTAKKAKLTPLLLALGVADGSTNNAECAIEFHAAEISQPSFSARIRRESGSSGHLIIENNIGEIRFAWSGGADTWFRMDSTGAFAFRGQALPDFPYEWERCSGADLFGGFVTSTVTTEILAENVKAMMEALLDLGILPEAL